MDMNLWLVIYKFKSIFSTVTSFKISKWSDSLCIIWLKYNFNGEIDPLYLENIITILRPFDKYYCRDINNKDIYSKMYKANY